MVESTTSKQNIAAGLNAYACLQRIISKYWNKQKNIHKQRTGLKTKHTTVNLWVCSVFPQILCLFLFPYIVILSKELFLLLLQSYSVCVASRPGAKNSGMQTWRVKRFKVTSFSLCVVIGLHVRKMMKLLNKNEGYIWNSYQ